MVNDSSMWTTSPHTQDARLPQSQNSSPIGGCLVERVLVLHGSGPPSPVCVVVVLGRSTRGIQQPFRAVTSALQAPSYSSSSSSGTRVTSGEGRKSNWWGRGAGRQGGIRGRPRRRCHSRGVKSGLSCFCSAGCFPGRGEDWRHGHICSRWWGEARNLVY